MPKNAQYLLRRGHISFFQVIIYIFPEKYFLEKKILLQNDLCQKFVHEVV